MFENIINMFCNCEYVPPCQRNPWYDDPRDVKSSLDDIVKKATASYFEQTVYEAHDMTPNLETVQQMHQCSKCGTFFIIEPPKTMIFGVPQIETLCHECRDKAYPNDS